MESQGELSIKLSQTIAFNKLKKQLITAVASGKNGVGKTWFSITLAHALSLYHQKTLLFDGDSGLSNIQVQLGLQAQYNLNDVISENKTLNQIIYDCEKVHFDVISGQTCSAGLMTLPIGRLQILSEDLHNIAQNYYHTILDVGTGLEKSVRVLSGSADNIIVLCTSEQSSLTDAYAFIKIMSEQHPSCNIKIVVNQADNEREGHRTYDILLKACTNFLKINPPLLGIIRRDTRVRDSIRNQTSIISRYPTSEATQDVLQIAKRLIVNG